MKTAEQIADEIEALNRQYRREYWEHRTRHPDSALGMRCAVTENPEVREILWRRSLLHAKESGRRWAMWRERRILEAITGSGDKSFGMAELVER